MAEAKIQFTPAQAAAIQARGGSLLVSAAAGSGKTRVLVERVAGLITDPDHPVDADSLLIMTFTNAAAAKLRADITARLAQEVRAHPGNMNLRRQQLLLQRASIGTVDAFCLHFVQQHFAMLDVPPDFETADEADLARIEQETLAATLETAYQDPDFRAFADLYDRGRTDNTAGDAILDLYHFTRALPHPAASLAAFAAMWQQDAPPRDTLWGKELLGIALAGELGQGDEAIDFDKRCLGLDRDELFVYRFAEESCDTLAQCAGKKLVEVDIVVIQLELHGRVDQGQTLEFTGDVAQFHRIFFQELATRREVEE